jgi:hypothetical protein
MLPKSSIESKLDSEIISLLNKLSETPKDSKDYNDIVDRLDKLHKLKTEEHNQLIEDNQFVMPFGLKPLSLDTVLIVSANVFGIIWLARFEKEHVITSRAALGFVMKPK